MGKFTDIVDSIMEASVGAATSSAPPTATSPSATGQSPSAQNTTDTDDVQSRAVLKVYTDMYEFFASPEVQKLLSDKRLTAKQKADKLNDMVRKYSTNANRSKLEQYVSSVAKQWNDGAKLKKAEMAVAGVGNVLNIARGFLSPTAKGSTGVFA